MKATDRTNREAGFSLPELMVSMVIMVIVMGAVLSQVKSAFQLSNATYEMTEAQQGLRFALEYLNRDLVTAGDGLRGINNIRLRTGFVQTYLTTTPVTDPTNPNLITFPIIASDNNVSGATPVAGVAPPVNVLSQSDRITILLIDPNFTAASVPAANINSTGANITVTAQQLADANFRVGEVYFINSQYGATFGAITSITNPGGNPAGNWVLAFANTDPCDINLTGTGGPLLFVARGPAGNQPVPTTIMRMQMIQYFVNANNVLVRRVFGVRGGTAFIDTTVAENVTGLQFRYFLADTAQAVNSLTTGPQQIAVRQVEASVTTQTARPINNGQRQSVSATTSISVRNLQFRQAL